MPVDTSSNEASDIKVIDIEAARQEVQANSLYPDPETTDLSEQPTVDHQSRGGGIVIEAAHRFAQVEHRQEVYAASFRDPIEVEAYNTAITTNVVAMRRHKLSTRPPVQGLAQMWAKGYQAEQRELITAELSVGSSVLGSVPVGHKRSFFNLDAKTWVWHEEWTGQDGLPDSLMTTYEFQPRGVLKTVNGVAHGYVEGRELDRLLAATRLYHNIVAEKVYGYTPATAAPVAAAA